MFFTTLKNFNWVDLVAIILFFRICYLAAAKGVITEIFKLLGVVCAIYLSMHYFTVLSDFFRLHKGTHVIPLSFLDFLSFIILIVIGYLIFVLLRLILGRFAKMETTPKISRIGGLILGFARAYLCVSLVIFSLAISSISYFRKSAEKAYYGRFLFRSNVDTYAWMWNKFFSKFMRGEKYNPTVTEVQDYFNRQ